MNTIATNCHQAVENAAVAVLVLLSKDLDLEPLQNQEKRAEGQKPVLRALPLCQLLEEWIPKRDLNK